VRFHAKYGQGSRQNTSSGETSRSKRDIKSVRARSRTGLPRTLPAHEKIIYLHVYSIVKITSASLGPNLQVRDPYGHSSGAVLEGNIRSRLSHSTHVTASTAYSSSSRKRCFIENKKLIKLTRKSVEIPLKRCHESFCERRGDGEDTGSLRMT
jgi:hypothetical protein